MKKNSGMVTIGGILSTFGIGLVGVPLIVMQTYAQIVKDGPPAWFNHLILPMLLVGFILAAIGHAITGVAGAGVDDCIPPSPPAPPTPAPAPAPLPPGKGN